MTDIDLPQPAPSLTADVIFLIVGMFICALLGTGLLLAALVHGGVEVSRCLRRELFKTLT
jgi:hypothetical protein